MEYENENISNKLFMFLLINHNKFEIIIKFE